MVNVCCARAWANFKLKKRENARAYTSLLVITNTHLHQTIAHYFYVRLPMYFGCVSSSIP